MKHNQFQKALANVLLDSYLGDEKLQIVKAEATNGPQYRDGKAVKVKISDGSEFYLSITEVVKG